MRTSPVFSQHVLQHRAIQRQLSYQFLQPAVLVLQLLQLADLVDLQPSELLLPAVERLFADPTRRISSATGIPISACFTIVTICSTENRFRFIRQNLPSSDFAENSLSNWINYWGAAH